MQRCDARRTMPAALGRLPARGTAVAAGTRRPTTTGWRSPPGAEPARRRRPRPTRTAGVAELSPPSPLADALALGAAPLGASPPPRPHTERQAEDTWSLEDARGMPDEDPIKVQGRRHMRELSTFTFKRWAFHRSTSRYARHMAGIFQSRIVRGLATPLLSAGGTATAVCVYEQLLKDGWLPAWMPTFLMPSLPFEISSFALSLLLVFRTNSSYDRWEQAISAWGDIATRSRDTLRQLLAGSARGGGTAGQRAAVLAAASTGRWLVAFSRSLKAQLTEDSDLAAELAGVLSREELGLLLAAHHRPAFALAVLSELAEAAPMRDSQRLRIDENLTFFADAAGRCERLLRTPIPLSYTRHTSRFMVIWLSCLPLGLWQACGFGTIPLTVVISFLLLGIEEIGVAIEEPFGILPLGELCGELELGLSDVLEQAANNKRAAREAAAAAAAALAGAAGGADGAAAAAAAAVTSAGGAASLSDAASNVLGFRGGQGRQGLREAAAIFASYDSDADR